jgi:peptidoglycan/LPS O-acetylase OafA/YrhL
VIARLAVYGSTAAALIVLRRREGPAPVPMPGGTAIAVLALAACAAVVATQTWQSVRDVAIVLAVGFVIRAVVRFQDERRRVRVEPRR